MRQLRLAAALLALSTSFAGAAEQGVTVAEFTPQGMVKDVRQVVARFSAPMVPLGDPRAGAGPFAIDCSEKGAGRWIDSRTWSWDFERDLPAGVRCVFTLRDDLKALSGAAVGGERSFSFDTGGPAVRSTVPYSESDRIQEDQAFVMILDAVPTEASVLEHVWFSVEGLPERVGVRILSEEESKPIVASVEEWELDGRPTVVLQAKQAFPNEAKVTLTWGTGVATASGLATTQDQTFEFTTRPAFRVYTRCERQNENADCVPFLPIDVAFTSAVAWDAVKDTAIVGPDGKRWTPSPPDEGEDYIHRLVFKGPFPEKADLRVELPAGVKDDNGRTPINDLETSLAVKTAEDPPLAKFSSRFGIIESADPVLPVTIRNLEAGAGGKQERVTKERPNGLTEQLSGLLGKVTGQTQKIEEPEDVLPWLRLVGGARRTKSIFAPSQVPGPKSKVPNPDSRPPTPDVFTLPQPEGPKAFEVVGIPLKTPGLWIVELSSRKLGAALLGRDEPMYVATAALVTNLAVHFKWGRDNALVWVTQLEDASPAAGAHVAIQDCSGKILWSGETNEQGWVMVGGLPQREQVQRCQVQDSSDESETNPDYYDDYSDAEAINQYALSEGLLVTAQVPGDISFVHTSWNDGIQPWRFQLPTDGFSGGIEAHTVLDRTLLRAGETVHMKHVLRAETMQGFSFVEKRPDVLEILHLGSSDKYELPLSWDEAGNAQTDWPIPKQAKLGTYTVVLRLSGGSEPWRDRWQSGSFRVEEFRVPLMRGTVQLPAEPQVRAGQVPVDVTVQYLAGGGAGGLGVRVRSQIRTREFQKPLQFEHFVFGNGGVVEGIQKESDDEGESGGGPPPPPGVHQREDLTLDAAGAARTVIKDIPEAATLRELLVEAEYRDPNGELQTVSSSVPLWPARWMVGIDPEQWVGSDKQIHAKLAVVDQSGKPVAGAAVSVRGHRRMTYSHRKRLVGGFYAYEHIDEIGPSLGELCSGESDARGLFLCSGAAPAEGDVILVASTHDDAGNESLAHTTIWVYGSDRAWFRVEDSDRIDVLPEKPEWNAGDTAILQVRSPFAEATALVTAEREGVLDARVVHLSGTDPVIQVPISDAYSPNIFISVFVVRGRVAGIPPTAMVDLGRPAFKLGIAELRVGWQPHTLKVEVSPEREVYKVRDKAAVKIRVRTAAGDSPPAGSEIALAAVDEGLLELQPNTSWNLLADMMGRRGYTVQTSTAQMQVVGKRHFGLKARPQGGGGGRQTTRELFDTLLLWNGKIVLDQNGEASAEVPLNDSLTSFRIAAVATSGANLFGNGGASIRSTQDLMLFSGLPPMVREGDRFRAEFTVRNTTEAAMEVKVAAAVEGLEDRLEPQTVSLAPGEAKVIGWDVAVPVNADTLRYTIDAVAGAASDRMLVSQQVRPAVPVRTYQATLLRWEKPTEEKVEIPAGAIPGRGGIDVGFAPSIAAGLDGVSEWMQSYPYSCLEQRVSRAVALRDTKMWEGITASLPTYVDGDGLLKYFPKMTEGSETLTSYVLSISRAAGLPLPADVQQRMEDALSSFVQGQLARRSPIDAADRSLRKLSAIAALARAGKATPAMLDTFTIEPNLWPTSAVLDWWEILQRLPQGGKAAGRQREAEQILRSRLNLQGTTMGFSTEDRDALWWLMVCPDGNAARVLLEALEANVWREDMPRLMRGLMLRQQRGHWDCTTSNAWGVLATDKFIKTFEAAPVAGTSSATLAGATKTVEWQKPLQPATVDFAWPAGVGTIEVNHKGSGNPWVTLQSRAALPLKEPLSSGYKVTKTVTPVEAQVPGKYSVGDILRIKLEIEAQAEMTWVVVDDPIPAGASHLGTGLARDSQIATSGEKEADWWSDPAFVERAFTGYRAYYAFVPKGSISTEYTIRLNQSGDMQMPTTRVEALYAPEMFGELPNEAVVILP